jgi:HK97 family phage portal protein
MKLSNLWRKREQRTVTWEDIEPSVSPELFQSLITSATGESVTATNAMQISAVFACVRLIASTMATVPLLLYRRLEDGSSRKERAPEHPLYRVLHDAPNPEMSACEFFEFMTMHLELRGNAYAEIVRNQRGDVQQLWPLRPDRMEPRRVEQALVYLYRRPDGTSHLFDADEILHLRALPTDGIMGLSVIDQCQESLGLSKASDKYAAKFFSNSAMPSALLSVPEGKALSAEAKARLAADWRAAYGNLDNAQRVAILEHGLSYQQISVTPEQAQFLESRKYNVRDIARLFGVPAHLIGDLEQATFSNIEHQSLEFVMHTIRPRCVRIEQAIKRQCLKDDDQQSFFAEFLIDALVRGDLKTRYEAYQIARMNGWMNADEIRAKENMNPIEDGTGEVYVVASNLIPLDRVGQTYTPPALVSPAADAEDDEDDEPEVNARKEQRASAAADMASRMAIRDQYRPLMQDAFQRTIDRESKQVLKFANATLPTDQRAKFMDLVKGYYEDSSRMADLLSPVTTTMRSYTSAIELQELQSMQELNPGLDIGAIKDGMESWRESWVQGFQQTYTARSQRELEAAIAATKDNDNEFSAYNVVSDRVLQWSDSRAAKESHRNLSQSDGALAREVWRRSGITEIVWHTQGGSCPVCDELDGKTIGIEGNFGTAGEYDVLHPPLHDGCDCYLQYVRGN